MVEVKDLFIEIKGKKIVNGISFEVKTGEILGLVGGNGSGKTVVMKAIAGLLPYDGGEILVNQKVIGKDIDFPKDMGLIIEVPIFVEGMSGYKNLCGLICYKHVIDKEDVQQVLEEVGLKNAAHTKVKKYSLGMRQRLGIAQAIMEKPRLLILDEPFNSLDEKGINWFREWLLKYKEEGNTIIISSHNKEDIKCLCDKVVCVGGNKYTMNAWQQVICHFDFLKHRAQFNDFFEYNSVFDR